MVELRVIDEGAGIPEGVEAHQPQGGIFVVRLPGSSGQGTQDATRE